MKLNFMSTALFICACLVLTACDTTQSSTNTSNQVHQENKADYQKQVLDKVSDIKNNLKIGLTKEEVKSILGDKYILADDNGDVENGSEEFWKYRFFLQDGYKSDVPDHVIDESGLKEKKVGVDLFIGWKSNKLHFYSISYVEGASKDIRFYILNPDGSTHSE